MNIRQVANYFDITPDHIRFLEYEGFIPRIERDKNGFRQFHQVDLAWIRLAVSFERVNTSDDFQLEYVQLYNLGETATPARKELVRNKCLQLQKRYQDLIYELNQLEKFVKTMSKSG